MGFPPATKNSTSKDATRPETKAGADATISKGSGGIPASLKIKNAGVRPAAFPNQFVDDQSSEQGVTGFNNPPTVAGKEVDLS